MLFGKADSLDRLNSFVLDTWFFESKLGVGVLMGLSLLYEK